MRHDQNSHQNTALLAPPSFVVGHDGKPTAVQIDLTTWEAILDRLEDQEDFEILRFYQADLEAFDRGERPEGWKSWEEFEQELDALELAGELPA